MALYPELLRAYRSTNLGSFMLLSKKRTIYPRHLEYYGLSQLWFSILCTVVTHLMSKL